MFGREEQLRALEEGLAEAAEGRPRIALVTGEAGVGKTRLLQALEAEARSRGFLVLHGESVEFGGEELPYAPITAALRDLPEDWIVPADAREPLTVLLPDTVPAAPAPAGARPGGAFGQGRLYEVLLGLLARLASERAPVLVALEDLHWADRSTRNLLPFLARNLRAERIALAVTYRAEELLGENPLRPLVAELIRRPSVMCLELEPLAPADAARQLEMIAGRPLPAALVADLHARTGGNPFFLEELFAAREGGEVPRSIAEALLLRIRRLDEAAVRLLRLVAAAGGRVGFDVLDELVPASELPGALRGGLEAGILVREAGDQGVGFRHALMSEVVYGELLPPERTRLHREIAHALAERPGAAASQLAVQWYRAGAHDAALAASVSAGLEAARAYAFTEARAHLERSLELWDAAGEAAPIDKAELLSRAAQSARFTGDRARAVELALAALDEVDATREPVRAALLYERLGEHHFWDDERALEFYGRALELLPKDAGAERARLLAAEGHALMGLRRLEASRARCEAALAAAAEAGAPEPEAQARTTLGLVLAFLGDGAGGEAQLRGALRTAAPGEATARAHLHLGEVLRLRGKHAEALATMVAGERDAERLGMRASFGRFMFINAVDDLLRLGRWDEAEQRIAAAERMDLSVTGATMRHGSAAQLYAQRGELARAHAHLNAAERLAEDGLPSEFLAPIGVASATLALAEAAPAEARRRVAEAMAATAAAQDALYTPPLLWLGVRAEADLADRGRALRRGDDVAEAGARAEALLAELNAVVARSGGDHAPPDALAHRALAGAEHGRLSGDPRPQAWDAAVGAWDELDEPYPAAYARFRAAEAILAVRGDRRAAARLLAAAELTAEALGAGPLQAGVGALARAARLSVAPDAEPARDGRADGPGLTRRESEVLALLAEGLTNREIARRLFVSPKTVETHVGHVFDKLDVHSRVEAAGRAQRLGLLGPDR